MSSVLDTLKGKPVENKATKLSARELRFVEEYIVTLNVIQSYINAGYPLNENNEMTSRHAYKLLHKKNVQDEIQRRQAEIHCAAILSATELLELYTKIAKGEVQDQFGLDASLKDRIAAMKELAKYQIELPMKLAEKQQQDNQLTIKLIRDK